MDDEISDVNLDVEEFIAQVQEHPETWDSKNEDYKDKVKKQMGWEAIGGHLIEGFNEKKPKERKVIVKTLSLKWRNIRDNYHRSIRKRLRADNPASVRPYLYEKYLSFLEKSTLATATRLSNAVPVTVNYSYQTSNHMVKEEEEEDESLISNPNSSAGEFDPLIPDVSFRQQSDEVSVSIPHSSMPTPSPDSDRAFFESILPMISNFTEEQKIDFRIEVLGIVRRLKRKN